MFGHCLSPLCITYWLIEKFRTGKDGEMKEIIIKKSAQVLMDLLLLADPSEAQIRTYLERRTLKKAVFA
jgi:hypothetical protein